MMPSAHGPMSGASTGARTAPAQTVLVADSVVATMAAFVGLIFILSLQSSLITIFAPSKRRRILLPNILENSRFVTCVRSLRLTQAI